MALEQHIVIVNEFNVKTPSGPSRGGATPGFYVERYAARADATENLTPVLTGDPSQYIMGYMARASAAERMREQRVLSPEFDERVVATHSTSGRAFSESSVSLSAAELAQASKEAQDAYDSGKTIMLTVLSFTKDYLEHHLLVPGGIDDKRPGAFRDKVDQLKLRLAVKAGMGRIAHEFDDLHYVAAIQTDTRHVHVHLASWDAGEGRVIEQGKHAGEQSGMLTKAMRRELRAGIDRALGDFEDVRFMSRDVSARRLDVVGYVVRHTYDEYVDKGVASMLVTVLPDDKRKWRASSNARDMIRANQLARALVSNFLARPDSGYAEQLRSIAQYASAKAAADVREDRVESTRELERARQLFDNGRVQVMDKCVDALYGALKRIPQEQLQRPSAFMRGLALEHAGTIEADVGARVLAEAGMRTRMFSERMRDARDARRVWDKWAREYDKADAEGRVSEGSRALRKFFEVERDYQTKVMCKYQNMLRVMGVPKPLQKRLVEFDEVYGKLRRLENMTADPRMKQMNPDTAERYGLQAYGRRGGRHVKEHEHLLRERIARERDEVDAMRESLEFDLAGSAHSLVLLDDLREIDEETEEERRRRLQRQRQMMQQMEAFSAIGGRSMVSAPDMFDTIEVRSRVLHSFADVRSLDLHHMARDFAYDADISRENIEMFADMAYVRADALHEAVSFLERANMRSFIAEFPVADVEQMEAFAQRLEAAPVLRQASADAARERDSLQTAVFDDVLLSEMVGEVHSVAEIVLRDIERTVEEDSGFVEL